MNGRTRLMLLALCMCAGAVFFATPAHAQVNLHDPNGAFTGLLDLIHNGSNEWADRLRNYAIRIFWMLATIQLIWTFFPLVLRQADFSEIAGELIRFIIVIGFFYALLIYSVVWANAIVDSFRQAGGTASGLGQGLRPGDIFTLAIEMAKIIGSAETWNPLTAVTIALAGVIVLLCFAFISAFMAVTLVESYIVINASVLFMGFGGSQWTREYALAMARYAIAVGAKLFVLTLIVGLIVQAAQQWQAAYNQDDASMWTMVGLSLVCAYLAKQIPDLVQSLITGTSMGGGHAIGGMAMAAATVATAGAATAIGATSAAAGVAGSATSGAQSLASGAASSGLASAINSTFSGNADLGRSANDGVSRPASSISPRVGGSASTVPPAARDRSVQSAADGGQDKQQSADIAQENNITDEGIDQASSYKPGSVAAGLTKSHIASGTVRTIGTLSAISVPGMESASGLTLGLTRHTFSDNQAENDPSVDFRQAEEQNTIAPSAAPPPAASSSTSTAHEPSNPPPIDNPDGDDKRQT